MLGRYKTVQDCARAALEVQDACNLSGVLHSWADCQRVLMDECRGNASPSYLSHPVNVLFGAKVASLMHVTLTSIGGAEGYRQARGTGDTWSKVDVFASAFDECKRMSGEG